MRLANSTKLFSSEPVFGSTGPSPISKHLQKRVRLAWIARDNLSVRQSFARYAGQQPHQNAVDPVAVQHRILEVRITSHPAVRDEKGDKRIL